MKGWPGEVFQHVSSRLYSGAKGPCDISALDPVPGCFALHWALFDCRFEICNVFLDASFMFACVVVQFVAE